VLHIGVPRCIQTKSTSEKHVRVRCYSVISASEESVGICSVDWFSTHLDGSCLEVFLAVEVKEEKKRCNLWDSCVTRNNARPKHRAKTGKRTPSLQGKHWAHLCYKM
jgi:hypothetical protein